MQRCRKKIRKGRRAAAGPPGTDHMKKNKKKADNLIDMPAADPRLTSPFFNAVSAEFVPGQPSAQLKNADNGEGFYDIIPDHKGNRFE